MSEMKKPLTEQIKGKFNRAYNPANTHSVIYPQTGKSQTDISENANDLLDALSPEVSHAEWFKILSAYKAAGGTREHADAWSRRDQRPGQYSEEEFIKAWESIQQSGGITAATLFYLAKEAGYTSSPFAKKQQKVVSTMSNTNNLDNSEVVAVYQYRDKEGVLKALNLRYQPKNFRPRYAKVDNPDPRNYDDRTQWSLKKTDGFEMPLYHEDEVAQRSGEVVYLCEGEKDADNLATLGYLTSCHKAGGSEIKSTRGVLDGRQVVIIADNDDAGRTYARKASKMLETARCVVTVKFPPMGKDFSEWLESQSSQDQAQLRVAFEAWSATPATELDGRSETSAENGDKGGKPHIELDQWARDFVENYYMQDGVTALRYYAGAWFEYRNGRYINLNPDDLRGKLTGALQSSGFGKSYAITKNLITNIVENMKSDAICGLPANDYHIPCFISTGKSAMGFMPTKNRLLDIEEIAAAIRDARPFDSIPQQEQTPDLFATYGVDYEYNPHAGCPKFLKYLKEVQPNEENRESLQMLAGLALVPDCRYNVAFFLCGQAGTGKSVFINVLTAMVGKDNTCSIPLANLSQKFGNAPLTEKLLNIIGDLPVIGENGRNDEIEGIFKMITSGDEIPVERKYADGWKAPAIARCVFATNRMPVFTDRSNGVWDRVRIIPFSQPPIRGTSRQNNNLANELYEELPGILNWAIRGLAMLREKTTFPDCAEGLKMKNELRANCDHERTFLREETEESKGKWVSTDELYRKYCGWMHDNGYRAVGAARFQEAVKTLYPSVYMDRKYITPTERKSVFCNIKLNSII